jgi:hypothetical protein
MHFAPLIMIKQDKLGPQQPDGTGNQAAGYSVGCYILILLLSLAPARRGSTALSHSSFISQFLKSINMKIESPQ